MSQAYRTRIRKSVHEIVFSRLEGLISNAEMNRRLDNLFATPAAEARAERIFRKEFANAMDRKTAAAGEKSEGGRS